VRVHDLTTVTVKNAVCWHVTPRSLVEIYRRFKKTFQPCRQTGRVTRLYEGGGSTFLRNVGKLLPVYTASHIRRHYSSKHCTFLFFTYIKYLLHKRHQAFRRRHLYSVNELRRVWWICPCAHHTGTWGGGNGSMAPLALTSTLDEDEWLLHFRWKSHGAPQYEAGWAPESIWKLRRCKSFDPARNWRKTPLSSIKALVNIQRLQGKAGSLFCHICFMLYFPSNHTGEVWLQNVTVKVFSFTENFSSLALPLFISPYSTNNLVTKLYFISRSMMELMPMSAWLDYHFNWNHVIL